MCSLHIHILIYTRTHTEFVFIQFSNDRFEGSICQGGPHLIRSKETLGYFVFVSFGRAKKTNEHNWNWNRYVNQTFKYHKSLISIQGGPFEWEKKPSISCRTFWSKYYVCLSFSRCDIKQNPNWIHYKIKIAQLKREIVISTLSFVCVEQDYNHSNDHQIMKSIKAFNTIVCICVKSISTGVDVEPLYSREVGGERKSIRKNATFVFIPYFVVLVLLLLLLQDK